MSTRIERYNGQISIEFHCDQKDVYILRKDEFPNYIWLYRKVGECWTLMGSFRVGNFNETLIMPLSIDSSMPEYSELEVLRKFHEEPW